MKKLKQMYRRRMEERKYRNGKTTGCPTVLLRVPLGHDRQCGFTLVELVITIAIVIILSVISVPIYRAYVDKSKMAEGYALIGAIISAQKSYYSEYGNFLRHRDSNCYTSFEPIFGIDARGNKYFTWFECGGYGLAENAFWVGIKKPADLGNKNYGSIEVTYNLNTGSTFRGF